jgi:hypothetical protein
MCARNYSLHSTLEKMRFWVCCLNAKSSEERVVYKKLNSRGTLIQRTTGDYVPPPVKLGISTDV